MVFPLIANAGPVVEAVETGRIEDLVSQGRSAGEARLLIVFYFHGPTLARGLAFAVPNCNQRCIAIGIDIEAVLA